MCLRNVVEDNTRGDFFEVRVNPASQDPRAKREKLVAVVAGSLRASPTLPASATDPTANAEGAIDANRAIRLPKVHCAFSGCCWTGDTDESLYVHVAGEHAADLDDIACLYAPHASRRDALRTAYNDVIAHRIRQGAPLACPSLQRRCVEEYMEATQEDDVCSPICFMCARSFPWIRSRSGNEIGWEKPFGHLMSEKDSSAIVGFGGVDNGRSRMAFVFAGIRCCIRSR